MLRKSPFLLSLLCIALLFSCAPANRGPDVLRIHINDEVSKIIGYDGSTALNGSVSIDSYRVSVTPSGSMPVYSSWFDDSTNTYEVSGLEIGTQYTIAVEGAIAMTGGTYTPIGSASTTHTMAEGTNNVSLNLTMLTTESESLTVTINAPADATGTMNYTGSLERTDGTQVATASASASGTASATLSYTSASHNLSPGVYILRATASNGTKTWGTVEAVRLLPGLPATGTITFRQMDAVDTEIVIDNQMGSIIQFADLTTGETMDHQEVDAIMGDSITVNFSNTDAGSAHQAPHTVDWRVFFNGHEQTTQEEGGTMYTFADDVFTINTGAPEFVEGRNIITFMASNGLPFGVGSMDYIVHLSATKEITVESGGVIDLTGVDTAKITVIANLEAKRLATKAPDGGFERVSIAWDSDSYYVVSDVAYNIPSLPDDYWENPSSYSGWNLGLIDERAIISPDGKAYSYEGEGKLGGNGTFQPMDILNGSYAEISFTVTKIDTIEVLMYYALYGDTYGVLNLPDSVDVAHVIIFGDYSDLTISKIPGPPQNFCISWNATNTYEIRNVENHIAGDILISEGQIIETSTEFLDFIYATNGDSNAYSGVMFEFDVFKIE